MSRSYLAGDPAGKRRNGDENTNKAQRKVKSNNFCDLGVF
jgi:hypothetical protein